MKLDYSLAQDLLLELEAQEDEWMFTIPPNRSERLFHALILKDRGYVEHMGDWRFRLTDAGHALCETLRGETLRGLP